MYPLEQRPPVDVDLHGPLTPAQADALHRQVTGLWADGEQVLCHVRGTADLGVVDVLARISLTSRRLGTVLRVRADSAEAARLLDLTGLATAVRLEVVGQAEAGEQRRVQEVVDVLDPSL